MPRQYSNKTLDALANFWNACFTHPELDSLFLSTSISGESSWSNKLDRSLNVVRRLSSQVDYATQLDELFDITIERRSELFEPDQKPGLAVLSLRRSLRSDGYDIREGHIVPLDELEVELATEISQLTQRLEANGMTDVVRTLNEAHQNYIDGNHEACNAMLRTSLESVLKQIAAQKAGGVDKIPAANPKYGVKPADVRNYLGDPNRGNFFEQSEGEFLRTFYGWASTNGSHPGLSNEAESRLRRLMIVAFIQYCLEKLDPGIF